MAEAMLLGVAKSVLGQLSSPALEEFLLVWNLKKDLKRLRETIETITCFIYDAEQRQSKERFVQLWLSRLKAALYEADDLFDAILARALHKKAIGGSTIKKEVTLFFSKSNHLGFVIKTAHGIKGIKECLVDIKDDMSQFQFQYQKIEVKGSHSVLEREERHSFVDNKEVIGRDREKEDIISLLLSEGTRQRNLEVISVIGFGGLGKTTLAQLVYNDERVQNDFDMCLWTCINYLSDLESVVVKILTSVLKSKPLDIGLDLLQRELREKIQGKKYLLVLDDIWDDNASNWSKLETLLSCGKIGSKVLITTRKIRVAQCLDAFEPFYKLGTLSEESAWSLFVKMTFKDGEFTGDSELDLLGKQILRKCGYVPLLLSLIGRVLSRRKKDKEVWLSFLEKEFAEVVAGDTDDENVMQVLKVSYNDLPLALKHCFAYCSVFPKDYNFEKDRLIRMWIAQGFIEPHAKKSLEEVGDDYFFYLVDTCFFQEVAEVESDFGVVKYTCKMHDFVHDLAIQVAGTESTSFSDDDQRNIVEKGTVVHHISLTCSPNSSFDHSNFSSLSNSLRTLILADAKHMKTNPCELILERFRTLRTLVLSDLKHTTLPDSFGGLIHLRYLDLSWNYNLTALPNSICKLYHLQTLLLTYCTNLVKLPSNLAKLVSLRHIILKDCWKLDSMPSGLATLTTLVSLDRLIVHPDHGGLRYLGRLDELYGMLTVELPVKGWTDCIEDARKANMSSKCRLSGLSIRWGDEVEEGKPRKEEREAVLEGLKPHPNLQCLQIQNCTSDKLPSWFSSLSNIKSLNLKQCSLEYLDVSVRCGYLLPHLQVLKLDRMECLRGWWRELASPRDNAPTSTVLRLPSVTKLEITECSSLVENMPVFEAVQYLTLEEVNVRLVNMLLGDPNAQLSARCHNYNSKLQVLRLSRIECLECLPEGLLKHLTALKQLDISYCEELRWISRRGLACLTSLEKLHVNYCGVVRLEDEDDDKRMCTEINNNNNNNLYYGLQRLRSLQVSWQWHLLQEGLQFLTSLQDLNMTYYEEEQVEVDDEHSECCTSGPEKLQRVELDLGGMECCFPNWTMHLPCLQELKLLDCGEMDIDDWVAQQTQSKTLVSLHLTSFKELLWMQEVPWKLLPSLHTLILDVVLSSIPDGIQQLTSLQCLHIQKSQNLNEIPKWMIDLTSLQELYVIRCSQELLARCDPETGSYWHLISHVPTIKISGWGKWSKVISQGK